MFNCLDNNFELIFHRMGFNDWPTFISLICDKECQNSKFGNFELLVHKETFADALLTGIVSWRGSQKRLCRRCTHKKNYINSKPLRVSPEKNHAFWVVTLLSQMGDMVGLWDVMSYRLLSTSISVEIVAPHLPYIPSRLLCKWTQLAILLDGYQSTQQYSTECSNSSLALLILCFRAS